MCFHQQNFEAYLLLIYEIGSSKRQAVELSEVAQKIPKGDVQL